MLNRFLLILFVLAGAAWPSCRVANTAASTGSIVCDSLNARGYYKDSLRIAGGNFRVTSTGSVTAGALNINGVATFDNNVVINTTAGSGTRLVTATSGGQLGNATSISGSYTWTGSALFSSSLTLSGGAGSGNRLAGFSSGGAIDDYTSFSGSYSIAGINTDTLYIGGVDAPRFQRTATNDVTLYGNLITTGMINAGNGLAGNAFAAPAWATSTSYAANTLLWSDAEQLYAVSKTNSNTSAIPSSSDSNWEVFGTSAAVIQALITRTTPWP